MAKTSKKTTTTEAIELRQAQHEFNSLHQALVGAESWTTVKKLCKADVKPASQDLTSLKLLRKELETKRKSYVQPLKNVAKRIDAEAKPLRDKIDQCMGSIERLLSVFAANERAKAVKKATKKAAKAEAKGNTELATDIVAEAKVAPVMVSMLSGQKEYTTYTAEVIDIVLLCDAVGKGLVPPDVVNPHQSALNAMAKESKGTAIVAGVEFRQKTSFRS